MNEKTKNMKIMHLGRRVDGRGSHPLAIPDDWKELALRIVRRAHEEDDSIPMLDPDVCVVNLYCGRSRLGLHQVRVPWLRVRSGVS